MKDKRRGHKRKRGGGFNLASAQNGLQQVQNLQGNLMSNANNGLQQVQNLQGNLLSNANNGLQQAKSLTMNLRERLNQAKDIAKGTVKVGKTVAMLSNPITALPAAMKLKHQLSDGLHKMNNVVASNVSKSPANSNTTQPPAAVSSIENPTTSTSVIKNASDDKPSLPNENAAPTAATSTSVTEDASNEKPSTPTEKAAAISNDKHAPTSEASEESTTDNKDDDPIQQLKVKEEAFIKELQSISEDEKMAPDEKASKLQSFQKKLEDLKADANMMQESLPGDASKPNVITGGGFDTPDKSKKYIVNGNDMNSARSSGGNEEKNKSDLQGIQDKAVLEIAKADVKLVFDYVPKTSDPRALKALFQYQEGKDKTPPTDKLSLHLGKVEEIIKRATTPKAIQQKAQNVKRDLQFARAKLYSVNIEAALRRIEDAEAEVSFFPDELKAEMTEKQKRITTAILVIFSIVKYIFKQFAKAPTIVSIFTILCLVVVVYSAYLALKYCIMIINDFTNNKLINNPTNAESLDFLIANFGNSPPRNVTPDKSSGENARTDARSAAEIRITQNPVVLFFVDMFKKVFSPLFGNLLTAKYKYALFVILPWISLIFAILAIFFMIRKRKQLELTPGLVQAFLYAAMVQTIIALFANYTVFFYAYYILRGTSARIDNYNKLVLASMSQRADFLAYLQKLPTNTIDIANVTTQAMNTLFAGNAVPSESDLSKAVFTLNLYEHYQQLGYRNPVLYEALDSFRIYNFIFSQQSFSPALYLRRRSTIIRDNSEKYRSIITAIYKNRGRSMDSDQQMIDNALMRSSQMTAEANNMANTFYPEDAMSRFLRMAIIIAGVQFLPFTIFFYLFRNRDLRNGFIDAIRIIMGQKKKAGEADLRDQEETVLELREMMHNKDKEKDQELPKPAPVPVANANPPVPVI